MSPGKLMKIGVALCIISLIFVEVETRYFGYNWFSKTIQEAVCDSIAVAIMATGFVMIWKSKK